MTNRQEDKIQMQRRMQSLYKKAKYQSKQNSGNSYYQDLPVFWKIIVSASIFFVVISIVMGALFDFGIDVPDFFGI